MKMRYVEVLIGRPGKAVLADAPHAAGPGGDAHTGAVVRAAVRQTGCHGIVGRVSRRIADLNRPRSSRNASAIDEYRQAIHTILSSNGLLVDAKLTRPILHLAIHGMKDRHAADVEIGTRHARSCSESVRDIVASTLRDWANTVDLGGSAPRVIVDELFVGDSSKPVHRIGDSQSGYRAYGERFHTIQLEFSRRLRDNHRDDIVRALSQVMEAFDGIDAVR